MILLVANADAAEVHRDHPYRREWKHATFGRHAAVRVGMGAAVGQVFNHPSEWGRGAAGFGKRVASGFGKHIVKTSVEYPVAAARHEDLHYYPSTQRGFGPRLRHALVSTVVTQDTRNGRRKVAAGRISGNVASGFISRAWQPAAMHTAASGAATAGIGLGVDAGTNVLREFWPEIRHPHQHGARRAARS